VSRIKVLSENITNRIAAGEVIERPASVVKELVENAIDAGALNIRVNIERAGSKLIAITDDGYGMDEDDALLCLEPHATSKIHTEKDILGINTFGFRGEALPSIASISRFTLRTRVADALEGTEVIVQGGKFIKVTPTGCAPGTEMIIRDLFFNTPARKKFLRTAPTEEKHIQETLYLLSLPHPQVSFELIMDGHQIFSSPGHDNLLPRIKNFFGNKYGDGMLEIGYSHAGVSVAGFTARHGLTRNTRREQRTFVNGRAVDAAAIFRGIREGYGGIIEKGRFPPTILFLKMDPFMVDVNVHPAKREVRFRNERDIVQAITEAVRLALRNSPGPTVTVDSTLNLRSILGGAGVNYNPNRPEQPTFAGLTAEDSEVSTSRENSRIAPNLNTITAAKSFDEPIDFNVNTPSVQPNEPTGVMPPLPASTTPQSHPDSAIQFPDSGQLKLLGFIDATYLLAAAENGLLVIDIHAAHERVLFEKILSTNNEQTVVSQKLLLPITVELSRAEAGFINKHADLFISAGFEIEPFSSNTIMVNAIPAILEQDNVSGILRDMLSDLTESGSSKGKIDINRVARCACIAAVKAHDKLTFAEASSLLQQMAECELPFSCPHGRPTVINISLRELEKRFGRR
jgi:DNA mismatch repair protein MutL